MNLYAANQALGNLCFTYICEIVFDIEIKLNEINRMKSSRTRTRHSKNNVFLIGSFVAIFLFFFYSSTHSFKSHSTEIWMWNVYTPKQNVL